MLRYRCAFQARSTPRQHFSFIPKIEILSFSSAILSYVPSYDLEPHLAEKILIKHNLGPVFSIEPIATGLINPVLLLNKQYILRIDLQTTDNPEKLKREAYLFNTLKQFNIPTPDLLGFDDSAEIVPYPYILISYIPGAPLDAAWETLNLSQKQHIAFQMGDLAHKIHLITPETLGNHPIFGTIDQWLKRYAAKRQLYWQVISQQHYFSTEVNRHITQIFNQFDQIQWQGKARLKHGDFSPGNIQISNGNIVGIFDFEFSYFADPLRDLEKYLISFQLPGLDTKEFLRGYQKPVLSKEEILRIKTHSIHQGLWEIHATITHIHPYGKEEIEEGKTLIMNALKL
jgi:aminoglycoside phosphotransferase (APT) family kinase protein